MSKSDWLVLVVGGFLLYNGYNIPRGGDTPVDTEIAVEYTAEDFPGPPDTIAVSILSTLDTLNAPAEDYLLMARAFKEWGYMVENDPFLLDLSQLAMIHKDAANHVLKYHKKQGFGGKLDPVVKELYNHELAFLKDGDKIKTTQLGEIGSPIRKALREWFDGLSWKMYDLFEKTLTKESHDDSAQPIS